MPKMRIRNIIGYATVMGGLAALLLASSPNKALAQNPRLDRLNQYLEASDGDYKRFNEEVSSEVKPLIDQVIKMMRDNGYCSKSKVGSATNPFVGEPRNEEYCNSYGYSKGLPDLFGKLNVQYHEQKYLGTGQEFSRLNINDFETSTFVEDRDANGLRLNEGDTYLLQEMPVRLSEAVHLLTKFNDRYKALLSEAISYRRK